MTAAAASARLDREAVARLFEEPLLELVHRAGRVHREHHDPRRVQCASLLSVKTGGCPEDCAYCPQSAHYETELEREDLTPSADVEHAARRAQAAGADRFCLGAAWREVRDGPAFDRLIEMVRRVKGLGLETCATLGMLQPAQAERLRDAGLDYYNHNLDTSPEFYDRIITTRTYQERLDTLRAVRASGMKVCCGGILGMGEERADRVGLLHELASLAPHPESVPINVLVPVEGTPLADAAPLPWDELVRTVAVARILMPSSMVRLSAGRMDLSEEAQALCFLAGANSIFLGDKLLTTANPDAGEDGALLAKLGLLPQGAGHDDVAAP
jgi:biotin synthase